MNHIKSLLLALFCTIQLSATPTEVVIPISANATVADLFTYAGADGKKHIKIPQAPHFQTPGHTETLYPAMYNQYLTLGSFLRFTKRASSLFRTAEDIIEFQTKLNNFFELIRKIDLEKRTPDMFVTITKPKKLFRDELCQELSQRTLHNLFYDTAKNHLNGIDQDQSKKELLEQEIIKLLESLPLSDSTVLAQLSDILSTKSNTALLKILLLSFSSSIKYIGDVPFIQLKNNLFVILMSIPYMSCSLISLFPLFILGVDRNPLFLLGMLIAVAGLVHSIMIINENCSPDKNTTNSNSITHRFSPEPGDGISVSFEVVAEKPVPQADTATERLTS
ncbi:hypothetical protein FJ366_04040 [Candidatus Dependentiae bacterium]|nr:hypothetical protein [Candidatus Dependentiae bacterium]